MSCWNSAQPFGCQNTAPGGFFLQVEQVQLPADAPVIAFFSFFEPGQVVLELLVVGPRRAIDPLQHLVARVAAPVGAGHLHEFEGFELAGGRHVRTAAKVLPAALAVQADAFAGRNRGDDFRLVVLADFFEVGHGLVARQGAAVDPQILCRNLRHAFFDRGQILG